MFIELIDLLRCPADHPETWLVAAFRRMDGRFVIEGNLGCPECLARYPIAAGVAHLETSSGPVPPEPLRSGEEETLRHAAMLGLTRPGSLVILVADSAALAGGLVQTTECRVIACNPPRSVAETESVGLVTCDAMKIPLASASADGIVWTSEPALSEAARVLRPGGRIVLAAGSMVDGRFRELASDERNFVAEYVGEVVTLKR